MSFPTMTTQIKLLSWEKLRIHNMFQIIISAYIQNGRSVCCDTPKS